MVRMTIPEFNETIVANGSNDLDSTNPSGSGGHESITLTGTGFEAVANPLPTMKDTFGDYGLSDGATLGKTDRVKWWNKGGSFGSGYKLSASNALQGRDFCAESLTDKAMFVQPVRDAGAPSSDVDKIYVSWYIKHNELLGTPTQPSVGSNKLLRIWDDGNGNGSRVSFVWPLQGYGINGNTIYPNQSDWLQDVASVWHKVEVYINSTAGEGLTHELWINGESQGTITGEGHDVGFETNKYFVEVIGYDVRNNSDEDPEGQNPPDVNATLRHWVGDFNQLPTPARVELSNDQFYNDSSSQNRVLQVTTSRTDSNIVIGDPWYYNLDQGSPIYPMVFKSDGTVIDGLGAIN